MAKYIKQDADKNVMIIIIDYPGSTMKNYPQSRGNSVS